MAASPAQIEANRRNAARSTGPKTGEGKARSRANALKHGLTGAGVVLADKDAAEVDRLALAFRRELQPEGEAGAVLARRMAVHAVRMDRCAAAEMAIPARFDEAVREIQPPPFAPNYEALLAEAVEAARREAADEAERLRKHAAAAERGFLRAMKELRQLRRDAAGMADADEVPPAEAPAPAARLGSFSPSPLPSPTTTAPALPTTLPAPARAPIAALAASSPAYFEVPIAIGRPR